MTLQLKGMAPLLQVFDMPTSLQFYRDKLGFQVIGSSGEGDDVDWVHLAFDGIELMLNTAYEKPYRPAERNLTHMTIHADTSIYFGCPDVDAAYAYMSKKGIDLKAPSMTGYGFRALFVTDPDGFLLVFHWPSAQ